MDSNLATSLYPATTEIDLSDEHISTNNMKNGSEKSAVSMTECQVLAGSW